MINVKQKWISALRSGRFKQGHEFLRIFDRYCPLGVLAHEMDWFTSSGSKGLGAVGRVNRREDVLPPHLMRSINLSNHVAHEIIHMNDVQQCSFDEIANYIEANM